MLNYTPESTVEILLGNNCHTVAKPFSQAIEREMKRRWHWWCESTIKIDGVMLSTKESYRFEREILSHHGHLEIYTKAEELAIAAGYDA